MTEENPVCPQCESKNITLTYHISNVSLTELGLDAEIEDAIISLEVKCSDCKTLTIYSSSMDFITLIQAATFKIKE